MAEKRTIPLRARDITFKRPTRAEFVKAVEKHPDLLFHGFVPIRGYDNDEARKNLVENCYEGFCRAVEFLSLCVRREKPNPRYYSYMLKHAAEKHIGNYVSQGSLIAAVIHLGIPYRRGKGDNGITVALSNDCPLLFLYDRRVNPRAPG